MIIDVSAVELIPGNYGQDCPGNGFNGDIECCCDECEYMMCVLKWIHLIGAFSVTTRSVLILRTVNIFLKTQTEYR